MKARALALITSLLALLLAASVSFAEAPPPDAPPPPSFSQQDLDQILAPIALYPDALLTQILMASTYPLEVVEAARWSRTHRELQGDNAVHAVESYNWDPSVKSLTAFPQILQMMDEKLDWTERLGDAFLAQQPQVMGTVQGLRQKAEAAGTLRSDAQVRVVQPQPQTIIIEQTNPEVVYVPYYDPLVVYGDWWWPAPPVYWHPWAGYYAQPGFFFAWGTGIFISRTFFYGGCDWGRRTVVVNNVNNYYFHGYNNGNYVRNNTWHQATESRFTGPQTWHHDPDHRRGVPYPNQGLAQHFGRMSAAPDGRGQFQSHGGWNGMNHVNNNSYGFDRSNVQPTNWHDANHGNPNGRPGNNAGNNAGNNGGGNPGNAGQSQSSRWNRGWSGDNGNSNGNGNNASNGSPDNNRHGNWSNGGNNPWQRTENADNHSSAPATNPVQQQQPSRDYNHWGNNSNASAGGWHQSAPQAPAAPAVENRPVPTPVFNHGNDQQVRTVRSNPGFSAPPAMMSAPRPAPAPQVSRPARSSGGGGWHRGEEHR